MRTMLDLFCGRGGWTNAFLDRGWKCLGIDIAKQPDYRGEFVQDDVTNVTPKFVQQFDFVCASPPCEEFSVWGLPCFHQNPKYPSIAIQLFGYTQLLCEISGLPWIIENVRTAQQFVGIAQHHCGPYYLWGTGVPPLMMQGINKPFRGASGSYMAKCPEDYDRKKWRLLWQKKFQDEAGSRKNCTALAATIPAELANCVADYAERLLEQ